LLPFLTLLTYKLSAYWLSDIYVSWLRCYMTGGYSFVWIQSIYLPPSEVLTGVPQGSVLGLDLFITVLCNFIKHSKHFLFADTIKISCSISSATDSTLPQPHIDSTHGQSAADLILTKTEVSSTMLTTYWWKWDLHVLWPTLRLLLTVPYCHTTPQLVLSNNMPHVPAVTLWLLMPVGQNTSKSCLQLSAAVPFSIISFTTIFMHFIL
jgi:hypothetical protein